MRGGVCVVKGGMHCRGVCVAGGHAWQKRGGRAWKERRLLQRTIRILLEYILVSFLSKISVHTSWEVTLKSAYPDTECTCRGQVFKKLTGNKTNNLLSSV